MITAVPRRRMARAVRRNQLVEVASEVFAEHGYGAASMTDVAQLAGVTKPVLYDHFGSKDGLLAAVVERVGLQLLGATAAAVAGASSPEQALEQGLRAFFDTAEANAAAWSLLLREVSPGTAAAAAVDTIRQSQVDHIAVLIDAQLPAPDPARSAIYAQIVSGAAERLSVVQLSQPALTAELATAQLMDVLWVGFLALQSGDRYTSIGQRTSTEKV